MWRDNVEVRSCVTQPSITVSAADVFVSASVQACYTGHKLSDDGLWCVPVA